MLSFEAVAGCSRCSSPPICCWPCSIRSGSNDRDSDRSMCPVPGGLIGLSVPLGRFMARVLAGERTWLHALLAPARTPHVPRRRRRPAGRDALEQLRRRPAVFNVAGLQHRGQLRHQHQLAGLQRRDDAQLPPDARPHGAELRLGGDRHGGTGGADSRPRAPRGAGHRQLLGRSDAHHALHPAAAVAGAGAGAGVPGRGADASTAAVTLVESTTRLWKRRHRDRIAVGPAASQIAIKQLGTNGGGFFNVNSAHPFENPTPLSTSSSVGDPAHPRGSVYTFGRMVKDARQGWAVLAAMTVVFVGSARACAPGRSSRQSRCSPRARRIDLGAGRQHGGQGGALRHRQSALWATATTAASNGSVNAMHDSFTPLGGLVPMWLMQLGEVDLRRRRLRALRHADVRDRRGVHRRPDGRAHAGVSRQEDRGLHEMKMAALVHPGAAVRRADRHRGRRCRPRAGLALANPARTASAEILYAFSSAGNNNGSAFGGLTVNTPVLQPHARASRCCSRPLLA
jgi:hypothetical protein